jgi:hypothetical protein
MGHFSIWSTVMMLSYWAKIKKNTEALLMASKEDDQEISADKIEYIFLPL